MWKAHVSFSPFRNVYEIRLAERAQDGYYAAISASNGSVVADFISEGEEIPVFLSLPAEALDVLVEAYQEVRPPASDADLREALTVERARVNRVLDSFLPRPAE